MIIKGLQKLTLIDYPGKVACTIFTFGCNFRCGYCHNPELVFDDGSKPIPEEEILRFLEERKNFLDGVCLSIAEEEPVVVRQNNIIKNIPIGKLWDEQKKTINTGNFEYQDCDGIEALTIKQQFLPVDKIIRHKTNSIYEITLVPGNYKISTTGGHSVFVLTKEGFQTKKVSELTKKDYLVVPKQLNFTNLINEIDVTNYLKEELSKSKEEMLTRKTYWYKIIREILRSGINFSNASKIYKKSWSTIAKYIKAYKAGKLEEACYTSKPNLLWVHDGFICVGKTKIIPIKIPITKELIELLGYAVAKGYYDGNSYKFALGDEPQFANRILQLFRRAFKTKSGSVQVKKNVYGRNQYTVTIGGKYLGLLIKKLVGGSAHEKKVPDIIFNVSEENKRIFLFAVNRGNGHNRARKIQKAEEFSIKSISRQLAADLILLLKCFGVHALLSIEEAKESEQTSYKIYFHANQFDRLGLKKKLKYRHTFLTHIDGVPKELLGIENLIKFSDQERVNIEKIPLKYKNCNKIFSIIKKWNVLQIKCIKKLRVNKYVYDLVVRGDHSFIGGLGPILLHNTGGEPTLHPDLPEFISKIKKLGFLVKLDTNGTNPEMLKKLIENKLVDFIAMDIKAPLEKYEKVVGVKIDKEKIQESINIIRNSGLEYEFRSTILPALHSKEDLIDIGKWLKGSKKFCIQNFVPSKTLEEKFKKEKSFSSEELNEFANILKPYFEKVEIRE